MIPISPRKRGFAITAGFLSFSLVLAFAGTTYAEEAGSDGTPVVPIVQESSHHEIPSAGPSRGPIAGPSTPGQLLGKIGGAAALLPVGGPVAVVNAAAVVLDVFENLGEVLWDVVKLGAPAPDFQTDIANALPQGVGGIDDLENWQMPVARTYCVPLIDSRAFDCTPGVQSDETHFFFTVQFIPGGDFQGHGKYLAAVMITPELVTLNFRQRFDAQTRVVSIANIGTADEPIAEMTMKLSWQTLSFGSPLKQSLNFKVSGDGKISHDPTVTVEQHVVHPRIIR
ncbi:MAG: hypothetical protein P4M08_03965 [Oligoflexia bacterium]|nr:hypothetical protein [Oligoflexia bacterium]